MRFSVIVPLYNKAPYVQKAIQSILNQSFRDFELIVVNDGSTDSSFKIASQILNNTSVSYQLIHQDNAGVSTARNNGVAKSRGEFICFLDADDWWKFNFLERMDWLIKEYPDAGIYGSNYATVKKGVIRKGLASLDTGYINYFQAYRKTRMPLTSISVCIPRHVYFSESGFNPTLKLGEDFDLWVRIALKHKVAFINEVLAYYNQDSDPEWRGTGRLINPKYHMLWNLEYLEQQERTNPDYKRLIDELRVYSLMPYYLSKKYHESAKKELGKVDWEKQPNKFRRLYKYPVNILRFRRVLLSWGSKIKQRLIKFL